MLAKLVVFLVLTHVLSVLFCFFICLSNCSALLSLFIRQTIGQKTHLPPPEGTLMTIFFLTQKFFQVGRKQVTDVPSSRGRVYLYTRFDSSFEQSRNSTLQPKVGSDFKGCIHNLDFNTEPVPNQSSKMLPKSTRRVTKINHTREDALFFFQRGRGHIRCSPSEVFPSER